MSQMKEYATLDCLSEHEHALKLNESISFYTHTVALPSTWSKEVCLCRGLLVSNFQQYSALSPKNARQVTCVYYSSQPQLKVINIEY